LSSFLLHASPYLLGSSLVFSSATKGFGGARRHD